MRDERSKDERSKEEEESRVITSDDKPQDLMEKRE